MRTESGQKGLTIDPAIAQVIAEQAVRAVRLGIREPIRGNPVALRESLEALYPPGSMVGEPAPDVASRNLSATAPDGAQIALRWYWKRHVSPGSAVVYVHGGGLIWGSIEHYDSIVKQYVQWTGVPFLAVDYRLAPEHHGESLAEDAFTGLQWLVSHAKELDVDPTRIAIMGDSAGGGVAAGAAILARDRGIALSKQILIYPMLDDRNTIPDQHLAGMATWSYDANYTGWHALLATVSAQTESHL